MAELNGNARSRVIRRTVIPIIAAITLSLFMLTTHTINALWKEQLSLDGNVSLGSWIFTATPTPFQPVDPGTTLKGSITANVFIPQSEEEINSGTLRQATYGLEGSVCIGNHGAYATKDLSISALIQTYQKGESYEDLLAFPVAVSANPSLPPGGRYCYPYRVLFSSSSEPKARYRIGAAITITNYSGWTPGSENCPGPELCPYGPWVAAKFRLPIPPTERVDPTRTPHPPDENPTAETPRLSPTVEASPITRPTITVAPKSTQPSDNQRATPTLAPTVTPVKSTPSPTEDPTAAPTTPSVDENPTPHLTETLLPTPAATTAQATETPVELTPTPTLTPNTDQTQYTATPALENTPTISANSGMDLAIAYLEEQFVASPGEMIVLQLAFANLGPVDATGVNVSTSLPEHTSFSQDMNSPGWIKVGDTDEYVYPIGELESGASGTILFAVVIDNPLPGDVGEITNTAKISDDGSHGPDIEPENNTTISQIPIEAP